MNEIKHSYSLCDFEQPKAYQNETGLSDDAIIQMLNKTDLTGSNPIVVELSQKHKF